MVLSLAFLGVALWIFTGAPYPLHADGSTWFWLALSGLVGYVFGSRFGQLFMTLAPPFAGIASTLMALTPVLIILPYSIINRQRVSLKEIIGTVITVAGVALFFLL